MASRSPCRLDGLAVGSLVAFSDQPMRRAGIAAVRGFGWLVNATALRPAAIWRMPALVATGQYSYGLYVFHPLVEAVVKARWPTGYGGLRSGAVVLAGSFVVAYLS